jgi:DNA-binding NtrC family response regulator
MKTLLIVDDEPKILEKIVTILSSQFDNITTAINGRDALEKLSEIKNIGCVVSDINMPVMNGIDFVKEVRNMKLEVPFIFFTSHGDDNLIMEAVKFGVFDFVEKPHFGNLIGSVSSGMSLDFKSPSNKETSSLASEYEDLLGKL